MIKYLLLILSLSFAFSTVAQSKEKKKRDTSAVSFEDLLVVGKHHFADEAVTTVAGDTVLEGLLGIRKDYRDRIKVSANQY